MHLCKHLGVIRYASRVPGVQIQNQPNLEASQTQQTCAIHYHLPLCSTLCICLPRSTIYNGSPTSFTKGTKMEHILLQIPEHLHRYIIPSLGGRQQVLGVYNISHCHCPKVLR